MQALQKASSKSPLLCRRRAETLAMNVAKADGRALRQVFQGLAQGCIDDNWKTLFGDRLVDFDTALIISALSCYAIDGVAICV